MQFLVANQDTTAHIFGHTYHLKAVNNPLADFHDIIVADEASASDLLKRHNQFLSSAVFRPDELNDLPVPFPSFEEVKDRSKILLLRSGGIGDHIMLLPAIRAFRAKVQNQAIEIRLAVQAEMFPIFQGNNDIDQLLPLPIPLSNLLEVDYVVDFSGSLKKALNPDLHLTDYFMRTLHLEPDNIPDKKGLVSQKLSESYTIIELFRRLRETNPNRTVILLNWRASTHIKSLPPCIFADVTRDAKDTIFLVIHPVSLSQETDKALLNNGIHAINISSHMKTLYDYFTAVSLSDAVVCSDTSTYHIASLYDKPSLVLIGPTYSILTKYYPYCKSMEAHYQGKHCTSPCGRVRGICPEAEDLGAPFSPCLMSISSSNLKDVFNHWTSEIIHTVPLKKST